MYIVIGLLLLQLLYSTSFNSEIIKLLVCLLVNSSDNEDMILSRTFFMSAVIMF